MSNLGEDLWQRAFEQGREAQKLLSIRNVMENAKLTSKQAMDALKIPESEQAKYLSMLNT